jgi:hypothetical protein
MPEKEYAEQASDDPPIRKIPLYFERAKYHRLSQTY